MNASQWVVLAALAVGGLSACGKEFESAADDGQAGGTTGAGGNGAGGTTSSGGASTGGASSGGASSGGGSSGGAMGSGGASSGGVGGVVGSGGGAGGAGAVGNSGGSAGVAGDGGNSAGSAGVAGDGGNGGGGSGAGGSAGTGSQGEPCGDRICELGETCQSAGCVCRPCPRGGLGGLPPSYCVTPQGTEASGPWFMAGNAPPSQAVDANASTTWNAGDYQGELTVTLPAPTAMAKVVLFPNAAWSPTPGTIDYTVTVYGEHGEIEFVTGQFTNTYPTAWIEFPLSAPRRVTQIKISGQSGQAWIALWEVLYAACSE